MGAAFLSAGGYHHHIGMNTWFSLNGKGHLDGESGLDYFTLIIPDRPFVNSLASRMCSTNESKQINWNQLLVSDPDGIPILIRSS
jgi:catechol 2,3-dioxygenase